MICQLSVKAISAYAEKNRRESESPLTPEINEIDNAVSNASSAISFESNRIREVFSNAMEYLQNCISDCGKKVEEIRFWLNETPAQRTVKKTVSVQVQNSDGTTSTQQKEVTKTYKDPYHDQLQQMLAVAEGYYRALKECRGRCGECERYMSELDSARSNFERAANEARRFISEIATKMGEHLKSLSEQSNEAAKCIKSAKAACGPFPAMRGDSGTVDVDGLNSYINDLQSKIGVCSAEADKLVRAAENLNNGWKDGVYTKFFNDTTSIRGNVKKIIAQLEYMNNALKSMRDDLVDYSGITPRVSYSRVSLSYTPVSITGRSNMSSLSLSVNV